MTDRVRSGGGVGCVHNRFTSVQVSGDKPSNTYQVQGEAGQVRRHIVKSSRDAGRSRMTSASGGRLGR